MKVNRIMGRRTIACYVSVYNHVLLTTSSFLNPRFVLQRSHRPSSNPYFRLKCLCFWCFVSLARLLAFKRDGISGPVPRDATAACGSYGQRKRSCVRVPARSLCHPRHLLLRAYFALLFGCEDAEEACLYM